MLKLFEINRNQRVAVLKDGVLSEVLGPGRHVVWDLVGLLEVVWFDMTQPVQPLGIDSGLPLELPGAETVMVGANQRLVVRLGGQVTDLKMPGLYRVWRVDGLELEWVDVTEEPKPLSNDDVLWSLGAGLWREMSASERRGLVLRYDGDPVRVLEAGRYRFWGGGPWDAVAVSLELHQLDVAVQDLVTADQVSVRLKPAASVEVVDPLTFVRQPKAFDLAYTAIQLAMRDVVAARSLEDLMSDRKALGEELLTLARANLPEVGLALHSAAIKDIILPGEVKDLLGRVSLARKEAEALAIKRREEVAQTRQMANTAKMLADNPVLMRLKELEAMGELVAKIDKLIVVSSSDLVGQVLSGSKVVDID